MLNQQTQNMTVSTPNRFADGSQVTEPVEKLTSLNDVVTYLSKEIIERQRVLRDELAAGYLEMAALNLEMAEEMLIIEAEAERAFLRQMNGV